jgi:uncharacterized protein
MSLELRPLGVSCNLRCGYCYQNPQRDAGNVGRTYDLARMMAATPDEGGPVTLFGGEPLLVPLPDLEALWAWGLERFGGNGIQTNGTLIEDAHIRLFKRYRVQVGASVDGPDELNDARWAGSLSRTRAATARTHAAIARLCAEGLPPSLIVTLHRLNAAGDRLPRLHAWVRTLAPMGIRSARLHVLEVDSADARRRYALTPAENLEAFLSFAELEVEVTPLRFDVFDDMRRLLRGQDQAATCVWRACDPYTTRAVQGVEGHGQRSNCGRTNKHGVDFVKAPREGFERYLALYGTPHWAGGCQGCRFFLMCKGQCPGTAIDGDWRNRTEHCGLWMALFEQFERAMIATGDTPLSMSPERPRVEAALIEAWTNGTNPSLETLVRPPGAPGPDASSPERGAVHADYTEHGDWHGDHADFGEVAPAKEAGA